MVWRGKVAIVTGASSGIGEELAVQLAAAGAFVVIAARRAEELARVAERARAASGALAGRSPGGGTMAGGAPGGTKPTVHPVVCDVTDRAQCDALVAEAVRVHGRVDVLVNNAGQGFWGRADEVKDFSVFERMLHVNYLSVVWMTLAALPHLKAAQGRILTLGSLSGKLGVPMRSAYGASKHAMTGFLDTLRIELGSTGVSVTTIHPGFVATGSQARNLGPDGKPLGAMPVKPMGGLTAAECARLLLVGGAARKRDVYPTFLARLSMWLRLIAPGRVDAMVSRAIKGKR
jgi:NAD(P)-dependent dehydrogenase (short-subunit alcohol dehydrogenase family)